MPNTTYNSLLAFDVGEKRIGVARANFMAGIAEPLGAIPVDGNELQAISDLVTEYAVDGFIIGLPRNMEGEETAQSKVSRDFAETLAPFEIPMVFQDESLTSVKAREELINLGKQFNKADIDSLAAVYILEDFIRDANAAAARENNEVPPQ